MNDAIPPIRVTLVFVGILLVVFAVLFLALGTYQYVTHIRLGPSVSEQPEEMTLERLIARGTEGNPNIVLKDFAFDANVLTETGIGGISPLWTHVWVPIRPLSNGPAIGGTGFPAIVKGANVHTQADLDNLMARKQLPGLIINKIDSLQLKERNLLRQKYPGADFDRVLLIEADRKPPTTPYLLRVLTIVPALGLPGIGLIYWGGWHNFLAYQRKRLAANRRT